MKPCPYCGKENEDAATICAECGTDAIKSTSHVTMKIARFQTDHRLWLWIALVLFLVSCCFPLIGTKGDPVRPVVWLWGVLLAAFDSSISFRELFGISAVLIIFACISAIASIVAAWLIQCVVVIIGMKKSERTDHVD